MKVTMEMDRESGRIGTEDEGEDRWDGEREEWANKAEER